MLHREHALFVHAQVRVLRAGQRLKPVNVMVMVSTAVRALVGMNKVAVMSECVCVFVCLCVCRGRG